MTPDHEVRELREQIVRRHMESENLHDYATTIRTFSHPRYEIIGRDRTYDSN
ncbi:MAG: hypothetical protein AABN33_01310 [Acidobacteriota bacterium]